jgi:hypothetical protein
LIQLREFSDADSMSAADSALALFSHQANSELDHPSIGIR